MALGPLLSLQVPKPPRAVLPLRAQPGPKDVGSEPEDKTGLYRVYARRYPLKTYTACACIVCCRAVSCLVVTWLLLLLMSLASYPYGACNAVGSIISEQVCDCSCYIASADDPEAPFYHPGAGFEKVADLSVRPDVPRERQYSICGACPHDYPQCVAQAKAQAKALEAAPGATDLVACNMTALTCYLPQCTQAVAGYYSDKTYRRPVPARDLCKVAAAAPACETEQWNRGRQCAPPGPRRAAVNACQERRALEARGGNTAPAV